MRSIEDDVNPLCHVAPPGRPEVVIEGSQQADSGWKEYDFKYKPGKLDVRPPVVIPHQPRLDWQVSCAKQQQWFILVP